MAYWLGILLIGSLSCFGVDYPEITGRIHNQSTLSLAGLTLTVEAKCEHPKLGFCGSTTKVVHWDAETGTFTIPSLAAESDMGASMAWSGYFKDGWGKRFDKGIVAQAILGNDLPGTRRCIALGAGHGAAAAHAKRATQWVRVCVVCNALLGRAGQCL